MTTILFSESQVDVLRDLGVDRHGEVQKLIRERATGDVFVAVCQPDFDEHFHNGHVICEYIVQAPTCEQESIFCIVSRRTFQNIGGEWHEFYRDLSNAPVGSMICVDAGSFGMGRAFYYITHHNAEGAWGYIVEDGVREARLADVA